MDEIETRARAMKAKMLANPGKYSAEQIQSVIDMLKPYAGKAAAPTIKTQIPATALAPAHELESTGESAALTETPSMIGGLYQGSGKSMEDAIPQTEAAPGTGMSYTSVPNAVTQIKWDPMDDVHAQKYNAFGPARKDEPALPPNEDYSDEAIEQRSGHEQWFQSLKKPELKSASRMPDIYADPIHTPKATVDPGASAIDRAAAHIKAAKAATPEDRGGSLRYHHEPTLQDFQRDMFPVLGESVQNLGEDSEQFKQYADVLYKREKDRAEAEGHGIMRVAYADMPANQRREAEALDQEAGFRAENPIGKLGTRAAAALRGQPGDEAVERDERAGARHPVASTLGGFALPIPGGGGASAGARIARSAVTGAGVAAGAQAGNDILGSAPTSAKKVGINAAEAGGLGLGLGAGFGGFGELATMMRPTGVAMARARAAGADTSVLHGMTPGPKITAAQNEVKALGLDPLENLVPHNIEKARPAVTKQLLGEEAKAELAHGTARTEVEAELRNHLNPAQALFDEVEAAHARQFGADKKPLSEPGEKSLRSIKRIVSRVTPADSRREFLKVIGPDEVGYAEKLKVEYGENAPKEIEKRFWEEQGKKFDKEAVPLSSNSEAEATNPGGRAKKPVSGDAPTEAPPTEPDQGHNLDTLSEGEEAELLRNAGTDPNSINAAKYGLKRVQTRRVEKVRVDMPAEGDRPARTKYVRPPATADVMSAKEARGIGVDIPANVPDGQQVLLHRVNEGVQGAKRMTGAEARAQGYEVPDKVGEHDGVFIEPRRLNPADLHQVEGHINDLVKAGRVPDIEKIQRAAKQVRDKFPAVGPARDATATIENRATGEKTDLKGLSAMQHNESEAMTKRALTRKRTGVMTDKELAQSKADPVDQFRNATTAQGQAPEQIADRSAAWERAGQGDALKFVEGLKAYQELHGQSKLKLNPFAAMRGSPFAASGNMNALQLHMDPILAGKYTPSAARIAAGAAPQIRKRISFDDINRLINPNPQGP